MRTSATAGLSVRWALLPWLFTHSVRSSTCPQLSLADLVRASCQEVSRCPLTCCGSIGISYALCKTTPMRPQRSILGLLRWVSNTSHHRLSSLSGLALVYPGTSRHYGGWTPHSRCFTIRTCATDVCTVGCSTGEETR